MGLPKSAQRFRWLRHLANWIRQSANVAALRSCRSKWLLSKLFRRQKQPDVCTTHLQGLSAVDLEISSSALTVTLSCRLPLPLSYSCCVAVWSSKAIDKQGCSSLTRSCISAEGGLLGMLGGGNTWQAADLPMCLSQTRASILPSSMAVALCWLQVQT